MIQDTVYVLQQAPVQLPATGISLGLQEVLVAIWAIFSVVMVPLTKQLINILLKVDKSVTSLTHIVFGIQAEGGDVIKSGLVAEHPKLERRTSTLEHTINNWIQIFKGTTTETVIDDLNSLEWKDSPRYKDDK